MALVFGETNSEYEHEPLSLNKRIYYLPGFGGRLSIGLGGGLQRRGYGVRGRELIGDFRNFSFQAQIDAISTDLKQAFWTPSSMVVANSFGVYLFLHAQSQLEPYVGRALLLSPIIGDFQSEELRRSFSPPRATKLMSDVRSKRFPCPLNIEIHAGGEDWQCPGESLKEISSALDASLYIVPTQGHKLDKRDVCTVLDRWL